MVLKFKVDKEKCISCGACISTCPKGADWNKDNKSKIINSEEIEECGGETVCPYGAILRQGRSAERVRPS